MPLRDIGTKNPEHAKIESGLLFSGTASPEPFVPDSSRPRFLRLPKTPISPAARSPGNEQPMADQGTNYCARHFQSPTELAEAALVAAGFQKEATGPPMHGTGTEYSPLSAGWK